MSFINEGDPRHSIMSEIDRRMLGDGLLRDPSSLANAAASALTRGDIEFFLMAAQAVRRTVKPEDMDVAARILSSLAELSQTNLTGIALEGGAAAK